MLLAFDKHLLPEAYKPWLMVSPSTNVDLAYPMHTHHILCVHEWNYIACLCLTSLEKYSQTLSDA